MSARVEGLNAVISNIRNIIPKETTKMNARLSAAGAVVEKSVKNHASLTDHSLADLAAMGHPYSKRYPADSGPHPDNEVHNQSGTLLAAVEKVEDLNQIHSTIEVGVREENVPYIEALIAGKGRQRPRNFIGKGFRDSLDEVAGITQGK